MRRFAAALLLTACAHAPAGEAAELDWLVGTWRGAEGETVTEEVWTAEGAALRGTNRTTRGGEVVHRERLRIAGEGAETWYLAEPSDQPAHRFRLVEVRAGYARFEDPAHDFPQVIEYRRTGAELVVTARGAGREARWRWTRQPDE